MLFSEISENMCLPDRRWCLRFSLEIQLRILKVQTIKNANTKWDQTIVCIIMSSLFLARITNTNRSLLKNRKL